MPPDSSLQEFAGVSAADSASSEVGDVEPGPTDEVETEAVILVKDESSRPECRICFDSEGDLICPCCTSLALQLNKGNREPPIRTDTDPVVHV